MVLYVHNTKTLPSPAPAPPVTLPNPEPPGPEPEPMDKPTKTMDPPPPPPPPLPPRETCEEQRPDIIRCDDPRLRGYEFLGENEAFNKLVKRHGQGLKKEKLGASTESGPCIKRGGYHTNVVRGADYIASIVGCNCCDDSSGKALKKERAHIEY